MDKKGRPATYSIQTVTTIYRLRELYGYGSMKISKLLDMPRETVRYYLRKREQTMNKVRLVILTYNKHDLARKAVDSALAGSLKPEIIIVDNSGRAESLPHFKDIIYPFGNVHLIPMVENLGTSKSWNWAMNYFEDSFVIFANDDVEFHHDTIDKIVRRALYSPAGLLHGSQQSGVPFNLFLLKGWAYDKVGEFDETFRPIYFEDDDFAYRLKLAEIDMEEVADATFGHVGSATLKAYTSAETELHHQRFRWNQEYYTRKWGGLPHQETYTHPFNGDKDAIRWHKGRKWTLPDKYTISVSTFLQNMRA